MLLDGKCGKSGQTNLIFRVMLAVGVVLCMPGQHQAFLPLAEEYIKMAFSLHLENL